MQLTQQQMEQRIKELQEQRDLFEHKMHMTDWAILMLKRYEKMKQYEDTKDVESN